MSRSAVNSLSARVSFLRGSGRYEVGLADKQARFEWSTHGDLVFDHVHALLLKHEKWTHSCAYKAAAWLRFVYQQLDSDTSPDFKGRLLALVLSCFTRPQALDAILANSADALHETLLQDPEVIQSMLKQGSPQLPGKLFALLVSLQKALADMQDGLVKRIQERLQKLMGDLCAIATYPQFGALLRTERDDESLALELARIIGFIQKQPHLLQTSEIVFVLKRTATPLIHACDSYFSGVDCPILLRTLADDNADMMPAVIEGLSRLAPLQRHALASSIDPTSFAMDKHLLDLLEQLGKSNFPKNLDAPQDFAAQVWTLCEKLPPFIRGAGAFLGQWIGMIVSDALLAANGNFDQQSLRLAECLVELQRQRPRSPSRNSVDGLSMIAWIALRANQAAPGLEGMLSQACTKLPRPDGTDGANVISRLRRSSARPSPEADPAVPFVRASLLACAQVLDLKKGLHLLVPEHEYETSRALLLICAALMLETRNDPTCDVCLAWTEKHFPGPTSLIGAGIAEELRSRLEQRKPS